MADSRVTLEVVLEGKNLKVVQKDLDKVTSSTNKASAATENLRNKSNRYSKGQKGVAGATANSTKAFSKMRSEIGGGSSGLVAAYATLAANLFAATAAFNALRAASKVDQLVDGLDRVGIESGRNLTLLADGLKEVTGNAISTEAALRSTALATSAGFSDSQLKNLGVIAKGASIALGRDLGDALDRLVRGTAKLEPEILDELGIFVRLDDAVSNYAESVGKSVEDITEFERRQAFLNEAITKGIDKFASIAEATDANPYDKLGATFKNLSKEILTAINTVLIPVLNVFANNMVVLGGAATLFASTISKQMLPALANGAARLAENAVAARDNAVETSKNLVKQKESLKVYNQLIDKIDEGTATQADFRSGLNSLDGSLATQKKRLAAVNNELDINSGKQAAVKADIDKVKAARLELLKVQRLQAIADSKENVSIGISQLQRGQLTLGFKTLTKAVLEYNTALNVTNVTKSRSIAIFNGLRTAVFGLATGFRVLATAFFALLGPVGLFLSIGPLVYDFIKDKFFPENVAPKVDEFISGLERINETVAFYSEALKSGEVDTAKFANAIAGSIATASEQIMAARIADALAEKEVRKELQKTNDAVDTFDGIKNWLGRNADGTKNFIGVFGGLKDKQRELNEEAEKYGEIGPRALEVIKQSVKNLEAEVSEGVSFVPEEQLTKLKKALKDLEDGEIKFKDFNDALIAARAPFTAYVTGLAGVEDQASDVKAALLDLSKRTSTPFDDLLEKTQALAKGYKTTENALEGVGTSNNSAFKRSEALLALQKKLATTGLYIQTKEELDAFNVSLETSLKRQQELPKEIKEAEGALAKVRVARGLDAQALQKQFEAEETLNEKRKELVQERLNTLNLLAEKSDLSEKDSEEKLKLEGELNKLTAEGLKLALKEEEVAFKRIQDAKKLLDLERKAFNGIKRTIEAERERRDIARQIQRIRSGADEPSSRAELAIFQQEKAERLKLVADENKLRRDVIVSEFLLADAQLALLEERAWLANTELQNADRIRELNIQAMQMQLKAADAEYELAKDRITLEEELLKKKIRGEEDSFTEGLGGIGQGFTTSTSMFKDVEKAFKDGYANIATQEAKAKTGNEEEKEAAKAAIARERLAMAASAASPFIEQLKALGPEGVLVAAVTEGSMVMADAFMRIGEAGDNMGKKLSAIGNIIGAIGGIAQAASQQKVAAIDQEIAAEKRRDGKSKESLAKIQALEAKKEKQKKKAFDLNKKLMMAQTVANTAAAVVAALGQAPFTPANFAMAALVGALGAAQLAIIAGTSYQGGGSSGSSNVPSTPTVEVGQRRSSVDLATSQGAAGELAYFRGAKGTGGPENFTPAFMGAKYRNEGGPTAGYTVGEQGPELFVPSVPGTIVPNDEMQQTPQNVNISINAIDSQGVEQVLVEQRGNIIGMIRDAANNIGEDFYEEIETAVYTPSSAGARLY